MRDEGDGQVLAMGIIRLYGRRRVRMNGLVLSCTLAVASRCSRSVPVNMAVATLMLGGMQA